MTVLTISPGQYHADLVADRPTLSASIATILCSSSPAHARAAHPRLNPQLVREEKATYDVGTAAHALLLEGSDAVAIVDADDWRTKDAKEARDDARLNGRVPLLAKTWAEVQQMVAAVRAQLDAIADPPPLFTDGKVEQTLVWDDHGVACRARLDWLRDDHQAIDDLKTTSRSANPETWTRTLFGIGADVQAAFYLRGLKAVTGADAVFRWVVAETYPPYALSVVSLGPDVLALAEQKVEYALETWRECLSSGVWPAYPARVCFAELPAWEEARWLAREWREAAA